MIIGRIENLPNEVLVNIANNLDIPDLVKFGSISCRYYHIGVDTCLWRGIAQKIQCTIDPSKQMMSQVRDFIRDLRSNKIFRSGENLFFQNTDDLKAILDRSPTIRDVNRLQNYLKARDTLIVWKELANNIGLQVPELDSLQIIDDVIAKAGEFKGWCLQNSAAIGQIIKLKLPNRELISLPDFLGHLVQLRWLDLRYNQLAFLPDSLGQLARLRKIIIYRNKLTSLPDPLRQRVKSGALDIQIESRISLIESD